MIEWIILVVILWGIRVWWKNTRIERKKQKFSKMRNDFASRGRDTRDKEALKLQRENIQELVVIVNKLLNRYKDEIPPRLFDETKNIIKSYVENVEFDKLYTLYETLQGSNTNNVYNNLENFRR